MEQVQEIKRGRGRPRKPVIEKQPKKMGRPKLIGDYKYDLDHKRVLVDRKRYNELLEIEKKYLIFQEKKNI